MLWDYFTFTKGERAGIAALLVLIVMIGLVPVFLPDRPPDIKVTLLDSVHSEIADEWGQFEELSEYAERFSNNRNKSSPDDSSGLYAYLPKPVATTRTLGSFRAFKRGKDRPYRQRQQKVDINAADTNDLIDLPWIGPTLARRIVAYRDRLGGFYDVNQLLEVYGIRDTTFEKFSGLLKCDRRVLRKIDLNTTTVEELRSHPYFRARLASAIVNYRNARGAFDSLGELRSIHLVDDSVMKRIGHYVVVGNEKRQ
jgi:competence protein ComEA